MRDRIPVRPRKIRDTAINAVKGFMAVGLFSTVRLNYISSVCLCRKGGDGIAGLGGDFGSVSRNIIDTLVNAGSLQDAMISGAFEELTALPIHF